MPHDIIDNRSAKLVDEIKARLPGSAAAHFAVGYFFVSGLEAVADALDGVQMLRLLIGDTTNRETIEQIAEGYQTATSKGKISVIERAFSGSLTQAVKKELNLVRQRELTGRELLAVLENIYVRHNLAAQRAAGELFDAFPPSAQVVCSEGF